MEDHLVQLETRLRDVDRTLEALRPPETTTIDFLRMPPSGEEAALLAERDTLETAVARVRFFVEGEDREWAVRHGAGADDALELVPLSVAAPAAELLAECGEVVVLSSAFLGHHSAVAEHLGLTEDSVRVFRSGSPFELEQRPIVYRPVGRLSRATLAELEPALFAEVAAILGRHAEEKGLIHAASFTIGRAGCISRYCHTEPASASCRAGTATASSGSRHVGSHAWSVAVTCEEPAPPSTWLTVDSVRNGTGLLAFTGMTTAIWMSTLIAGYVELST